MVKQGRTTIQKRLSAPRAYPIERKVHSFTIRTQPGKHKKNDCIPIGIILREILAYAKNLREVRYILSENMIEVDGRIVRSHQTGVGPMDVLSIPKIDKHFRILPFQGRRELTLVPIDKEEAKWKLCKIMDKRTISNAYTQITLHDGRNITLTANPRDDAEKERLNSSEYLSVKTRGTLKLELKNQRILDYYPFSEDGKSVIITRGVNRGIVGILRGYEKRIGKNKSIAIIETDNHQVITALDNIFIIGLEAPVIKLPSVEGAK